MGLYQCSFPALDYFTVVMQNVNIGDYWVNDMWGFFILILKLSVNLNLCQNEKLKKIK